MGAHGIPSHVESMRCDLLGPAGAGQQISVVRGRVVGIAGDNRCKPVHNDPRTGDSRCIDVGPEDRDPRGRVIRPDRRVLLADDVTFSWAVTSACRRTGTVNSPRVLMRLVEADAPPLDLEPVLGQEVGDVRRGHRAEELALVGGLPALLEAAAPRCLAPGASASALSVGLGVLLLLMWSRFFRFAAVACRASFWGRRKLRA